MTAVEALVALIEQASGIVVPERDLGRLERTASERASALALPDLAAYVRLLRQSRDGDEWRQLLSLITIKESYLFRAPQHWRALAEDVVPALAPGRPERRLQIWSAGCARGEEASTIASVLADCRLLGGWDWRILATDVDEEALAEARRGMYAGRAVSRVPTPVLERHFAARGGRYQLDPELHRRIEFRPLNLIREPLVVPGAPYDVIYLRNVLIYFRPESQRRVVRAIAEALTRDGYLFLGPSESLMHLSRELVPVDLKDCFCYRWPQSSADSRWGAAIESSGGGERAATSTPRSPRPTGEVPGGGASPRPTGSTARKAHASPQPGVTSSDQAGVPPPRWDALETVVACIVDQLSSNHLERARELIAEGAERFPDAAALRAFEGIAFDIEHDDQEAVRAYRAALYLDPRLIQVRFFLARCIERLDCPDRSRRDYRELLVRLGRGDHRMLPGSQRLGLPSLRQLEAGSRQALGEGTGEQ